MNKRRGSFVPNTENLGSETMAPLASSRAHHRESTPSKAEVSRRVRQAVQAELSPRSSGGNFSKAARFRTVPPSLMKKNNQLLKVPGKERSNPLKNSLLPPNKSKEELVKVPVPRKSAKVEK